MKNFLVFVWILAGITMTCFFSVSTYMMVMTAFSIDQKMQQYEELWTRGWDDWNSISVSIRGLTETTYPFVVAFPKLISQIEAMNESVAGMNRSVNYLAETIPYQVGSMSNQMGTMQRNMTPPGMMRNIMPW